MQYFIKSIFAGIMIGIACLISMNISINWVGAILFSIGLLIIVLRGYNLYTGKIGYVSSFKETPTILICIIGNLIGTFLISHTSDLSSYNIMASKLSNPLYLTFIKSIGCGFLMYLAVDIYKKDKSTLGVITCVPAFILAGFEHSIADSLYIFSSGMMNIHILIFLIIVLIGNAIGAFLHKLL